MSVTPIKPYKIVFTVVERPRDGRKFWLRVGVAFENRDGSLNVHLDAVPVNGQLQIRDSKDADGMKDMVPDAAPARALGARGHAS